ncbi:hypothetical protein G4177_34530 [Corallococcus sp. ZKHCc1 1396]|uniref:PDZ domain-containing protein n=1 Tax=Corallococcus soli TaxID=2710757 RepID=A0ABR9PZC1_9BACT|nr:PDZ domain-containing protein [Corallococcus soli]MBE4753280.1 hypothetical protein [Corallococcus soli]
MPAALLLLSAATSLFTTTWLLAAAPFTVAVEPVGFSVRSNGEEVVITQVVPGGPAAREGLKAGMQIQNLVSPLRPGSHGPLTNMDEADLRTSLTPTWEEPLIIIVGTLQKNAMFTLQRTDKPPRVEFPVIPLPPEQVRLLTVHQQLLYTTLLSRVERGEPGPVQAPTLDIQQDNTAWVTQGQLQVVDEGGFTGQWVHPRFVLKSNCPERLEKLVVRGGAGRPQTLRPDPGSRRAAQQFTLDLPLWPVRDVTQGCAKGLTELTASVVAEVSCVNDPVLRKTLPLKLALTCDQPIAGWRVSRLLLNMGENDFLVGAQAVVPLEARLASLIPQATFVTVVEVDDKGKVTRRFATAPVTGKAKEAKEVKTEVALDTKTARTVRLAAELKFADGSTRLTPVESVDILTAEQKAKEERDWVEGNEKLRAFTARIQKERPDPCANVAATVEWIQQQPEVSHAWAPKDGHNFNYQVKGFDQPMIFMCHHR